MPNHVDNDFIVGGPTADVDRFLAEHCTGDAEVVLDLSTILPYPDVYKRADEAGEAWDDAWNALRVAKFGDRRPSGEESGELFEAFVEERGPRPPDGFNAGGYEWCISNWGTKWGCYHGAPLDRKDYKTVTRVQLRFDTAWSPFRIELLEELSRRFPTLKFTWRYYERGMGFRGKRIAKAGEILLDDYHNDYRGNRGG